VTPAERALVTAARKPGVRVYLSCPLTVARASPRALDAVHPYVRRVLGPGIKVRRPPAEKPWNLGRKAQKDGERILVMLTGPDGCLGSKTVQEWRAFVAAGRPAFAVIPGRGLVVGTGLDLVVLPKTERTPQRFARLVAREGIPA